MILLNFLPLYLIIFIANLTAANRNWHWIVAAFLLLGNLIFMVAGAVLLLLDPQLLQMALQEMEMEMQLPPLLAEAVKRTGPGLSLLLTGIAGTLFLFPQVRGGTFRALRLDMERDSTMHMVAVIFAFWLVGQTMATVFTLIGLPVEAVTASMQVSIPMLWELGVAFVLFAVLGVGLGLRRSTGEALERLGVTRITRRHVLIAIGAIIALNVWDVFVTVLWSTVAPGSLERTMRISETIFSGFMTPLGALTIGLSAGIGEEILFRGALQPRFGILLANILFVVGHTQYEFSLALLSVFVIGLVLGYIRRRENTTTAIMIHAGYNMVNVVLQMLFYQ